MREASDSSGACGSGSGEIEMARGDDRGDRQFPSVRQYGSVGVERAGRERVKRAACGMDSQLIAQESQFLIAVVEMMDEIWRIWKRAGKCTDLQSPA